MAEKKNILVFPAGTEIAFEIHQALRCSKFVRLYGATSVPCHAEFVFERCYSGLPFVNEPGLIDALNEIIDREGIDYLYPAHDSALLRLTREQAALHCALVSSPLETVEVCRDKNKTYAFLAGADYLPQSWRQPEEVPAYPVFLKPAVGQGSQGARRIDSREALTQALSDGVDYAICEYLPGEEFTVDCFTDRHGALRLVSPRTRERIRAGIAVRSRPFAADARIRAIAEDINRRLCFNGAWFFQLKQNAGGDCRLMEIAPRIAGTMGVTRNLGCNLPLLTLYNHWGYDVGLLINRNEELLDRAFISRFQTDIRYTHVYVDFDDTLIVDGMVNFELMAFLYQAKNKGKSLHLLSRHARELLPAVEKYAISPALFDEILHLEPGQQKADFILPDSIFIDDSFAERKRVKEACQIPVFDLDMVESLMDWRM